MTDTPIVDTIMAEVFRQGYHSYKTGNRELMLATLRAANPWTPPAEEIEAMAQGYEPAVKWASFQPWVRKAKTEAALSTYRARPIMRELYDNDGALR